MKEAVEKRKCQLRVVLLNPNSPFITALEKHYKYENGELLKYICEATDRWKQLAQEVNGKQRGTVKIYYFNGQPVNSLYRIDNRIVIVTAKNSKGKSSYLPFFVCQKINGKTCLYDALLSEIEAIISEATEVIM